MVQPTRVEVGVYHPRAIKVLNVGNQVNVSEKMHHFAV